MAEVPVSGGGGRRDDRHALGQEGHGQLLVERQHALLLQLAEYLAAALRQVAQGIGGVDVMHREAVAVQFVEADGHAHQHLDAGGERLSRGILEVGLQHLEDVGPDGAARLGHQRIAPGGLLHELHVAMAAGVDAHVAQLRLHPVGGGHLPFQGLAHKRVQFI